MRPSFFHHLHPPTIPEKQARLRYTLGAGGFAVFLSMVVGISGALELFFYIPSLEEAALSVQTITFLVPYGWFIRNLHYWSAQALIVVTALHLFRVIFTGSYGLPRRFNYLLGLGLLVLTFLLDFTGYALRWDEGVRWAIVAGTNLVKSIPYLGNGLYGIIIGGDQPGQATLIRFYGWHIFALPLGFVFLGVWHLFRVRRDGGIAVPPPELRADQDRITRFELVRREVLAAILAGAFLLAGSIWLPAPLAPPIQDLLSNASGDTRAPWFFLWVQELLRLGNPFMWGVLLPVGVLVLFALLAYIFPNARNNELGRWNPPGNRLARWITALIGLALVGLTVLQALR